MAPVDVCLPESAVFHAGAVAGQPYTAVDGQSPMDSFFDPCMCQTPEAFQDAPVAPPMFFPGGQPLGGQQLGAQQHGHPAIAPLGASQLGGQQHGAMFPGAQVGGPMMFCPAPFMGMGGVQMIPAGGDAMGPSMVMAAPGGMPMMQQPVAPMTMVSQQQQQQQQHGGVAGGMAAAMAPLGEAAEQSARTPAARAKPSKAELKLARAMPTSATVEPQKPPQLVQQPAPRGGATPQPERPAIIVAPRIEDDVKGEGDLEPVGECPAAIFIDLSCLREKRA